MNRPITASRTLRFESSANAPRRGEVRSLMRPSLPLVSATTPITDAEAMMLSTGAERVLITDHDGIVSGILCAASLIQSRLTGLNRDATAGQLAGVLLLTCGPDFEIAPLAAQFREARHSLAIVLENGRSIGTLHRTDVLRWLVSQDTQSAAGTHGVSGRVSPAAAAPA